MTEDSGIDAQVTPESVPESRRNTRAAQQMAEAIGPEVHAVRLIRDGDGIYSRGFDERSAGWAGDDGHRTEVAVAERYAERFVGTLRRELLDHLVVLGEWHLLCLVREYARYHKGDRPHMSPSGDAPATRAVERPGPGKVIAFPRVGGLHHRYARQAA